MIHNISLKYTKKSLRLNKALYGASVLLEIVYCRADADNNSGIWMIVIMCVSVAHQTSSQYGQKKILLGSMGA